MASPSVEGAVLGGRNIVIDPSKYNDSSILQWPSGHDTASTSTLPPGGSNTGGIPTPLYTSAQTGEGRSAATGEPDNGPGAMTKGMWVGLGVVFGVMVISLLVLTLWVWRCRRRAGTREQDGEVSMENGKRAHEKMEADVEELKKGENVKDGSQFSANSIREDSRAAQVGGEVIRWWRKLRKG